jgi:hypothetical protein
LKRSCSAASSSCSAALSNAVCLRWAATSNRHHRCSANAQRGSDHHDGRGRPPVRDDGGEDGDAHAGKERMPLGARRRLHVFTLTPLGHQGLTPWIRFGNRQSLQSAAHGARHRWPWRQRARRREPRRLMWPDRHEAEPIHQHHGAESEINVATTDLRWSGPPNRFIVDERAKRTEARNSDPRQASGGAASGVSCN